MSQDIKNVILVGAGGNLGRPILNALIAEPAFTVTILSRESSTSTFPDNIKVIKSDYTHASLVQAFTGQDAVISAVAGVALSSQIALVDAAIEARVQRFIPGEYGNDTTNDHALSLVPLFAPKRAVADHLQKSESSISWTGISTGPFFDWGLQVGFLGFDLKNHSATIYQPGHDQRFSATLLADIGTATARALLPANNAQTKNKYVFVRSLTTTQDEVLAALEKATGKTWERKPTDLAPLAAEAGEKLKKGDFSGIIPLLLNSLFDPESGMDYDKRGILSNELLGVSTKTVDEAVKETLAV